MVSELPVCLLACNLGGNGGILTFEAHPLLESNLSMLDKSISSFDIDGEFLDFTDVSPLCIF